MNSDNVSDLIDNALDEFARLPVDHRARLLVDNGVIKSDGSVVTSQVTNPNWNASFAVIAVRKDHDGRIIKFRCLMPAFGHPGGAKLDIRRESMEKYIRDEHKRVITARINADLKRWEPGEDVRLTSAGYFRTDPNDVCDDNLGEIPELSGADF